MKVDVISGEKAVFCLLHNPEGCGYICKRYSHSCTHPNVIDCHWQLLSFSKTAQIRSLAPKPQCCFFFFFLSAYSSWASGEFSTAEKTSATAKSLTVLLLTYWATSTAKLLNKSFTYFKCIISEESTFHSMTVNTHLLFKSVQKNYFLSFSMPYHHFKSRGTKRSNTNHVRRSRKQKFFIFYLEIVLAQEWQSHKTH